MLKTWLTNGLKKIVPQSEFLSGEKSAFSSSSGGLLDGLIPHLRAWHQCKDVPWSRKPMGEANHQAQGEFLPGHVGDGVYTVCIYIFDYLSIYVFIDVIHVVS